MAEHPLHGDLPTNSCVLLLSPGISNVPQDGLTKNRHPKILAVPKAHMDCHLGCLLFTKAIQTTQYINLSIMSLLEFY